MRYATLLFAFILLIATPVLAQEFSPIIVKTGKPVPSVIRSGEPFKVTYRAKFFDTVIIAEDKMQPDNLALDKVEVIGLETLPADTSLAERLYNDFLGYVNVKDFTYTFRIIQPEKSMYKVPAFNFIWVKKEAGTPEKDAKEKEEPKEFLTDEVVVNYVTSVVRPPKPQPLDIRDESNFISPVSSAYIFRSIAYTAIGIASLIALVVMFRFSGYSKVSKSQESVQENDEAVEVEATVQMEPILPPKQARKKFLKELQQLRGEEYLPAFAKMIRPRVRTLLIAECQGVIRNSMSENEIFIKLSELSDKKKKDMGTRYKLILDLAKRLKGYKENIDSDNYSLSSEKEINSLRLVVLNLETGLLRRIWLRVRLSEERQ